MDESLDFSEYGEEIRKLREEADKSSDEYQLEETTKIVMKSLTCFVVSMISFLIVFVVKNQFFR